MIRKFIGDKAFYKKIWVLILPIMLQNAVTHFVSMIDNIMIGSMGTEQMSAVAIVNQIIFVFNLTVFGVVGGIGIFTAQYFGKNDEKGVKETIRLMLATGAIVLIIAIIIFSLGGTWLINSYLHEGNEPMDLSLALKEGQKYLFIMLFGLLPFTLAQVYGSAQRIIEKPVPPMIAGIAAVFTNVTLNYILIFGNFGFPRLGVTGAAIATLISRYVEALIIIIWAHAEKDKFNPFRSLYKNFKISISGVKLMLPKAFPLIANETCWGLGIALQNSALSIRGLDVIAAVNMTSTITNLFNITIFSFGTAISIVVGGLLGAGKIEEAIDTNRKMTFLSASIATMLAIILTFVAPHFPKIYNTTENVMKLGTAFIICYAAYTPFNALMNSFYFAIRSGGKTVITFIFDSVYMLCITVPFTYFLAHFTNLTIIPVYALMLSIDIFKVAFGFYLISKKTWAQNIVSKSEL